MRRRSTSARHALALVLSVVATAQDGAIFVKGGTLHPGPGVAPYVGSALIVDGKIKAVGTDLAAPEGATLVDATGKHVYPAFIDVLNDALLEDYPSRPGLLGGDDRAIDLFDRFADRRRAELLRAGVGIVGLGVRANGGRSGVGAAIGTGLGADGSIDVRDADHFVQFDVAFRPGGRSPGFGGQSGGTFVNVMSRAAALKGVEEQLDAAKKYRETWEKYAKDFEEYEKKKKAGEGADSKPAEKKDDAPGESRSGPRPLPDGFRNWPREKQREWMRENMRRSSSRGGGDETAPASSATSNKLLPPEKPKTDPDKEALVKVLKRETRLCIWVEWEQDIGWALDLAEKRDVKLALFGAAEAGRLLDRIKGARAVVVLPPPIPFEEDPMGGPPADLCLTLARAGIPFAFTAAGRPELGPAGATFAAAMGVGRGLTEDEAAHALGAHAALALGLEKRLGRIEAGFDADLAVFDGSPFAPGARAEVMISRGRAVGTGN